MLAPTLACCRQVGDVNADQRKGSQDIPTRVNLHRAQRRYIMSTDSCDERDGNETRVAYRRRWILQQLGAQGAAGKQGHVLPADGYWTRHAYSKHHRNAEHCSGAEVAAEVA
jgi:hypothetical protein